MNITVVSDGEREARGDRGREPLGERRECLKVGVAGLVGVNTVRGISLEKPEEIIIPGGSAKTGGKSNRRRTGHKSMAIGTHRWAWIDEKSADDSEADGVKRLEKDEEGKAGRE